MTNQKEIRIAATNANRTIVRRAQRALRTANKEARNAGLEINDLFHGLLGGLLSGVLRPDVMKEIAGIAGACRHSDPGFHSAVCKANDIYGVLVRGEAAAALDAEKRWKEVQAKYA